MLGNYKSTLIKSYKDGLVFIKNYLLLNDGGAKDGTVHEYDVQQKRKVGMAKISEISKQPNTGRPWDMRRLTACLSTGTVYGMRHEFVDAGRQQSIYGLNRECITKDGFPNAALVAKYLRETAPSVDIKEQRINLYEDVLLAGDFYDNPTALLILFLQTIQKYRVVQRLSTYPHKIKLGWESLQDLMKIGNLDMRYDSFIELLKTGTSGCGTSKNDLTNWDLMTRIESWVSAETRAGRKDGYYTFDVTVWKCYTYDDGHSKSGLHFGDHYGFVNGRYIVPQDLFKAEQPNTDIGIYVKTELPTTDSGIKHLKQYKHWINCSNLSEDELMLLHSLLEGNKRSTPLLVDQDIDFGLEPASVAFIAGEITHGNPVRYDDRMLTSLMHKLVSTHRWHEDALNAAKLMKCWYAAPGTETVESHWWTHVGKVMRYPTLGLKRAAIPCLMLGDAVCTSVEAIEMYDSILTASEGPVIDSIIYNTAWQWGEYLLVMNAADGHELLRNLDFNYRDDLNVMTRANVLVSSILGVEVDVCSYEHCYNYIKGGLDKYKNIRLSFGKINIDHTDEYGYTTGENTLWLRQMVAPACPALITGKSGTLLDGTPLHSTFTINPQVLKRDRHGYKKALNYSDLWCYGTVGRWNGHDVKYRHPLRNGKHTIYCANNVNIACPPVSPNSLNAMASYDICSIEEREKSWGKDFSERLSQEQLFYWTTDRIEVLSEPEWGADVCYSEVLRINVPRYYTQGSDLVKETIARLSSTYDIFEAGFRVTRLNAGITLRKPTAKFELDSSITTQEMLPPAEAVPPDLAPQTTSLQPST